MVDQLWLWIIDHETVVTFFPGRENDNEDGVSREGDVRSLIYQDINGDFANRQAHPERDMPTQLADSKCCSGAMTLTILLRLRSVIHAEPCLLRRPTETCRFSAYSRSISVS